MMASTAATRRAPRNLPAALVSGMLMALTDALMLPCLVLVYFVSGLTDSLRTTGAVITVGIVSWLVPRILTPWLAGSSTRQYPWALGASIVRTAAVIFLAYSAYRENIVPDDRLRSFFFCYIVYCVASGFAHVPVNELIARATPGESRRQLMIQRAFWGGLLAILGGLVARQALGPAGPHFPRNVALLFIMAAAAATTATFFLARLREPRTLQRISNAGPAPIWRDFGRVLRDGAYWRFVIFGGCAAIATMADPFYLIFARREYQLPTQWVGTALILYAVGVLISSPVWAAASRLVGSKGDLQGATAIRAIPALMLFTLPYVLDTDVWRDHVSDERWVYWILVSPFLFLGISLRGSISGGFAYLFGFTIPRRRSAYQLLALAPLAVAALAPLIGAEIAGRWGFDKLFLATLCSGMVAVLAGGLLVDTNARVRSTAQAWRLREAQS